MLTIGISLILGDYRYDQHCVAVRLLRSHLPTLDRLEVWLPPAVTLSASPGDDCQLTLEGGDGKATVFKGQITTLRQSLSGAIVEAHNGGLLLARYRPTVTLEQLTVGEVTTTLCGDVDVSLQDTVDGPTLALYVAEGRATAAQEIARLARLAGASGGFDGEGNLHISEAGGPGGELALRYGREVLSGQVSETWANTAPLTVVGEGAAEASSPEGRWIITDFLRGGGRPTEPTARTIVEPELRSTADTEFAAAALLQARARQESQVRLRTWLHPQLQPGMRLKFADMADQLPLLECRIRQVVSTIAPGKPAMTEVWASGQVGSANDFGGLVGALGGLL
jgi:hypothetical protein